MSIKHLDVLFNPRSIAIIGANEDKKAVGYYALSNLIGKGFQGIVYPVNPLAKTVQGIPSYKKINDIPYPVDLAVVAYHPDTLSDVLEECGHKNVKGVIILEPSAGYQVKDHVYDRIKKLSLIYGYRVLGPNSLGFLRPAINLSAGFFRELPPKGNIAFISEGGIFASAFLEHAMSKNVGFSYVISLGAKLDINFSDIIDFLGMDSYTKAIVLHVREIRNGGRFMTAVRSFAGSRPVLIIKSGKPDISSSFSLTYSGVLAAEDKVHEAAFRRAGAVTVNDMVDALYMIQTLAKQKRPKGKRLAIISNSVPPADMAFDVLVKSGGVPTAPKKKTLTGKKKDFPGERRIQKPVYLRSNALPAEYMAALTNCLICEDVDGILLIYIPFPGIDPVDIAEAIVSAAAGNPNIPVFATLLGNETVVEAVEFLKNKGIPTYLSPEEAVKCFMYMYRYDNNLQLLRETPEIILRDYSPETEKAEGIIRNAVDRDRQLLYLDETGEILKAYGIPVAETLIVLDEEDAVREAERIGYPVVLKIDSAIIPDKLQKGGVLVNLKDEPEVRKAFTVLKKLALSFGDAGAAVIIQPMIIRQGCELAIGAKKSRNFGTVIVFGLGGLFRGAVSDYSIGLPPLNQALARHVMEDTKIYRYLKGMDYFKDSLRYLEEVLVRFSQLIVDFPQIKEVDINPFLLTKKEGIVLDASMYIDLYMHKVCKWHKGDLCPPHLSIPTYPFKYVNELSLIDGTPVLIRPIRGEDEPAMRHFFETLSEQTIALRFGMLGVHMTHEKLVRFCQIDYDRELAFIAVAGGDAERIMGEARMNKLPDLKSAELSFVISDQWQGKGVGDVLMTYCIRAAGEIGLKSIWMEIHKGNIRMINFGRKYDFRQTYDDEDMIKVTLQL